MKYNVIIKIGDCMNRRGFTLIELLAVILILGIISLIAIPVVNNIMEESKINVVKTNAENFINGINNHVVLTNMSSNLEDIIDGTYTTDTLLTSYDLSIKGTKPTNDSWVTIIDGEVMDYSFSIDGYIVTKGKKPQKGATIESSKVCVLKEGSALSIGSKYECDPGDGIKRIFYLLEVKGNNIILIMDRNIDNLTVSWNSSGKSADGMKEVMEKLTSSTTDWTRVSVDLPTGRQIANTVENNTWTEDGTSVFGLPKWLFDYLALSTNPVDNLYAYWTKTPVLGNSYRAWRVNHGGTLDAGSVDYDKYAGLRPVIIILKSNI